MRNKLFLTAACLVLFGVAASAQRPIRDALRKRAAEREAQRVAETTKKNAAAEGAAIEGIQYKTLTEHGGRVSWYHGTSHELIAFDRITDKRTQGTDLFIMKPDGSDERCVTCSSGLRKGFVGQPAWHPDGENILIQVENDNSQHRFYNHVSFGIDNDLYLIRKDGTNPVKLFSPERFGAVLHPHFNDDGTVVIWSERIPTGKGKSSLERLTPGGENHWDGWRIHIADFDARGKKLSNHRSISPKGDGFYETHGFSPEGRIVFSFTPGGQPYVDDVYEADMNGKNARNMLNSPQTWDEHGEYSPNGRYMAFMSSRVDPSLSYPKAKAQQLETELYLRDKEGKVRRLTDMNERLKTRIVVSDYDWDRSGKRIVFQVARLDGSRVEPQLWLLTLPDSYD